MSCRGPEMADDTLRLIWPVGSGLHNEHQDKVEQQDENGRYNDILRKSGAGELPGWESDHRQWSAASRSGELQPPAAGRCRRRPSCEGHVDDWFFDHFQPGGRGDPQRQTGWSGGFDARFRDAGNYGYGTSAAAAGLGLDHALNAAAGFNKFGTGKSLPAVNERAIRQGYGDFATRFLPVNKAAGQAYLDSVKESDRANRRSKVEIGFDDARDAVKRQFSTPDVKRYALKKWGDLNSPDAQAFVANFQQPFGGYPQHLDLDLLQPLSVDGRIPNGKDVSLFVGRNGEVLVYARPPAPGGTGALRGICGLDGGESRSGSTGLNFFQDGTPRPASVQPHLASRLDPTGGIDVTLANGAKEHWWSDAIDGFKRDRVSLSQGGSSLEKARRPLAFPVPPMVYSLPDPSAAAGDNMDDWFDRWIKPPTQQ